MDGVGGVTQKHIQPGETYAYEFPLVQSGTQMYHPHSDEMVQMAMGMEGFLVIHRKADTQRPWTGISASSCRSGSSSREPSPRSQV